MDAKINLFPHYHDSLTFDTLLRRLNYLRLEIAGTMIFSVAVKGKSAYTYINFLHCFS